MKSLLLIMVVVLAGCSTQLPVQSLRTASVQQSGLVPRKSSFALPPGFIKGNHTNPPPVIILTITASAPCDVQTSTDFKNFSDLGHIESSMLVSNQFEIVRAFRGKEIIKLSWVNTSPYPTLLTQWSESWAGGRSFTVPYPSNSLTVEAMSGTNRFTAQAFNQTGTNVAYTGFVPEVDYLSHPPSLSITYGNLP